MEPSELDDWAAEAAACVGVTIQPGDVSAVLDLARDAAHGIARPAAPLTAFIAGMAVGRGQPTAEAVAALTDAIRSRAAAGGAPAAGSADAGAAEPDAADAGAAESGAPHLGAPDGAAPGTAAADAAGTASGAAHPRTTPTDGPTP